MQSAKAAEQLNDRNGFMVVLHPKRIIFAVDLAVRAGGWPSAMSPKNRRTSPV